MRHYRSTSYADHDGQFGSYLGGGHFMVMLVAALFLHTLGAVIYYLMPSDEIEEIPVRVLNVKLGGNVNATAITSADVNRLFKKRRLAKKQDVEAPAASASAVAQTVGSSDNALAKVMEKRAEVEAVQSEPQSAPAPVVTPEPTPIAEPEKPEIARAALETPKPTPEPKVEKELPLKPKPVPSPASKPKVEKLELKVKKKEVASANEQREVTRQPLKTKKKIPVKPPKSAPVVKKKKSQLKKYVRSNQLTAKVGGKPKPKTAKGDKGAGSIIGNSKKAAAEARVRYTQTVSLWIDKHKVYPQAARTRGVGGKVILRIRINRQGRILRYMLEKSSDSETIDRAITQMIDAANPLPSVPFNYPDKRPYLEFLIPINFIP